MHMVLSELFLFFFFKFLHNTTIPLTKILKNQPKNFVALVQGSHGLHFYILVFYLDFILTTISLGVMMNPVIYHEALISSTTHKFFFVNLVMVSL